MTNYEKMEQAARELFLSRDQEAMIRRWELEADADGLYFDYFSRRVRLDRHTGILSRGDGSPWPLPSTVNASMVLFDLLTHGDIRPRPLGEWAGISILGGVTGPGHARILNRDKVAAQFAGRSSELAEACRFLGGVQERSADVAFAIPVFRDFAVLFQFWDGDEEFAPRIRWLFDRNSLAYMHYETLWYVMSEGETRLRLLTGDGRQSGYPW